MSPIVGNCSLPTEFNLQHEPLPFRVSAVLQRIHNFPFRFGYDRDISLWIHGTDQERRNYLKGLFGSSIVICCIFVLWVLLLLIFKCLGPKKVGLFSAQRLLPQKPVKPEAIRKLERNSFPLQMNGVAMGRKTLSASHLLQPPETTSPSNHKRQRKRERERHHGFEKIRDGSTDKDDDDNDFHDDDEGERKNDDEESEMATTHTRSGVLLTEDDRKIIRQYEQARKHYEHGIYVGRDRIRRVRIGAGFCACGAIISAIMFTVMTERYLIPSFQGFENGLDKVDVVLQNTLEVANVFTTTQESTKQTMREFLVQIDGICPKVTPSLCSGIDNEDATTIEDLGCNFTDVPYSPQLTDVISGMVSTVGSIGGDIGNVPSDLRETKRLLNRARELYPETGVKLFWGAAGCSISLGFLCLLSAVLMTHLETSRKHGEEQPLPTWVICMRSYIIVPCMVLLVTATWILTCTFIFMGLATSDLCYDAPDEPVLNLLENKEGNFDSLVYDFERYYISGCREEDAPLGMEQVIQSLQEVVIPALVTFGNSVQEQNDLEAQCGTEPDVIVPGLDAMGDELCRLGQSIGELRELFQCDEWRPLYVATMHEAVCDTAAEGFVWAATTQTCLLIFCLWILTLRVAYYETTEVLGSDQHHDDRAYIRKPVTRNKFKPSDEIPSPWLPCCCCCDPVIPEGHIGEINMRKAVQNASVPVSPRPGVAAYDPSLPGMAPDTTM